MLKYFNCECVFDGVQARNGKITRNLVFLKEIMWKITGNVFLKEIHAENGKITVKTSIPLFLSVCRMRNDLKREEQRNLDLKKLENTLNTHLCINLIETNEFKNTNPSGLALSPRSLSASSLVMSPKYQGFLSYSLLASLWTKFEKFYLCFAFVLPLWTK